MGRKKRDYVVKHKQSLGDVIENPETYGVRVSAAEGARVPWPSPRAVHMRRCRQRAAAAAGSAAEQAPPLPCSLPPLQTQPRPSKRRRQEGEDAAEAAEEAEEGFVPAAITSRILKEARTQQEEVDADEAPAGRMLPGGNPGVQRLLHCGTGAGRNHASRGYLRTPA